jgi:murein DD-endopeptidase MepM/ murein hydrolase activator NlpD
VRVRLLSLLLVISAFCAGPSSAEPRTNHRFHIWTDKLRQRVKPTTRQGVDAVGCYLTQTYNWRLKPKGHQQQGTAFLVERSGNRGLVLTNAHVIRDQEGVFTRTSSLTGAQVAFRLGGADKAPQVAKVRRLVLGARHLDFALVEVDLPPGLRDLKPVKLSRGLPDGARRVYTAGFPGLNSMNVAQLATALGRGTERLVQRTSNLGLAPRSSNPAEAPKTVQVGRLKDGGRVALSAWGSGYKRPQLAANLPAFHGSSGSPVFDAQTGVVTGLLRGMEGYGKLIRHAKGRGPRRTMSWNTRIVPMRPILDWVGQQLQQGKLPVDLRQRVSGLLGNATP